MTEPRTVQLAIGKHNHWTGMVWEWGEDTLVNSTWALKKLVEQTGLKVGLNFDGRGIEQLAVVAPECIEWLKKALADGMIEIWGGTYTQPYGGLVGAESNIRQRVSGVEAFEKILGARPRIFSEEEFDFFPQLPQVLVQLGYQGALLFPQHTWHTPTWPKEEEEVILWEGSDGTRIIGVPYSDRCLMRGIPTAKKKLSEQTFYKDGALMVTWLEILDKPNWMWRTEFALPFLQELLALDDVKIEPLLLSEYLSNHAASAVRSYGLDECFHGITVGKNGDAMPKLWRKAEGTILRAEFLAAWCSYLGQPYPQFDSYPEWQLAEAWRFLMMSQGHDAYECEGLTNRVGHRYAQMAIMLAKDVVDRCERHLGKTAEAPAMQTAKRACQGEGVIAPSSAIYGEMFDENTGELIELRLGGKEDNVLGAPFGLPAGWKADAKPKIAEHDGGFIITTPISGPEGKGSLRWTIASGAPKGQLVLEIEGMKTGLDNAIRLPVRCAKNVTRWRVDAPFSVEEVHPNGSWLTGQPAGHWLVSQQEDHWIERPLMHQSLVAADWDGGGIWLLSAQNNLALAREDGFDEVIFAWDAWDQGKHAKSATIDFQIAPTSGTLLNSGLLAQAQLFQGIRFSEFLSISGRPCVTAIRKVGDELEVRLFEPDREYQSVELEFLWQIETARRVSFSGHPIEERVGLSGSKVRLNLRPCEIVTLRIMFAGKQTEYMPIDEYRDVWVG